MLRQHTLDRLRLIANGYDVVPCHYKKAPRGDYLPLTVSADFIRSIDRHRRYPSTAIRLSPNLVVIDADYDFACPAINAEFRRRLVEEFPQLEGAPVRRSTTGSDNFAILANVEGEGVRVMFSNEWFEPGNLPGGTIRVEILGGHLKINAFGPRDEGSGYYWECNWSPLDVTRRDLPILTRDELGRVGDLFDEVAKAAGLERLTWLHGPQHEEVVYDLTLDMVVDTAEWGKMTVAELEGEAPACGGGEYFRGNGSVFDWHRTNPEMLSIRMTRHGLQIYDFKTKVLHRRVEAKPLDQTQVTAAFDRLQWMADREARRSAPLPQAAIENLKAWKERNRT